MALEIMMVADVSKPYWEDAEAIRLDDVDPVEWETLFFRDLGIKTSFEYTEAEREVQSYEDYYVSQVSRVREKFPLIVRMKDYYEDSSFSNAELSVLKLEILSLTDTVRYQGSKNFLNQLLNAIQRALEKHAGLILVAD